MDHEDGIINCLLTLPETRNEIFASLKPSHFHPGGRNKQIFKVLKRLYDEFKPEPFSNEVVVTELQAVLPDKSQSHSFWKSYIESQTPYVTDVRYFIRRVIDAANSRRIQEITNAAEKRLRAGESPAAVAEFTREQLDKLESTDAFIEPTCFFDIAAECIEKIESGNMAKIQGISTGYIDIDRAIIGLRDGDLIIIAGRPSHGKTTLATNIAMNAAATGRTGLVFSLEMNKERIGLRVLSQDTGIYHKKLSRGDILREDVILSVSDYLKNLYFIFSDDKKGGFDASDVCLLAETFAKSRRLDFIMLDYLQFLNFKRSDRHDLEVARASRHFKQLAAELQIPFILISQLSRANEKAGVAVRKPRLSDLRDSGALEQDADIIIFIHRPEQYDPNNPQIANIAEILIAKNRDGETGEIKLYFNKKINKFESLDKYYERKN